MIRPLFLSILLFSLTPLTGYTPPESLSGNIKSIRTYKVLLRDIPAGTLEEPWLPNIDYDEEGRPVTQRYYDMGQEYRRHEFRYETDGQGRERTVWVTYYRTPDLRPPFERLAGYEHWYTLREGDESDSAETRFETVQNHPVKSVYRYYDGEGRLVHETDTMGDLEIAISFDGSGNLIGKRGYRGEKTFWEDRYFYDGEGRLLTVIQSDLNNRLYERGEYLYEEGRLTFTKYILDKPVTPDRTDRGPLGSPVFQSIKEYDGKNRLTRLRNYNWNGPTGFLLTQEQLYSYDDRDRLTSVEEPNSKETWILTYDSQNNWITLTYRDRLNNPDTPLTWRREITYYQPVTTNP